MNDLLYYKQKTTSGKGGGVLRDTRSTSLFDIVFCPMNFSGAKPKPQVLCSPGRFASKGASAHGAEFVAPPRCQDETKSRHFATWLQTRGLAYRYRLYPNQQVWPAIQPNFKSLLG